MVHADLSCSNSTSCAACIDAGCYFCSGSSSCIVSTSECSTGASDTCNEITLTIVFAVILAFLLLICMITCYARRHYEGRARSLFSPLLSENARQFIWRNSLLEKGEYEWMCVICGFDNKPRNKLCTLCGITKNIN